MKNILIIGLGICLLLMGGCIEIVNDPQDDNFNICETVFERTAWIAGTTSTNGRLSHIHCGFTDGSSEYIRILVYNQERNEYQEAWRWIE